MSADRSAKLRKLNAFRKHIPYVSASALPVILNIVDSEGVPELHGRHDFRAATCQDIDGMTPYGKLLISVPAIKPDGSSTDVLVVNPLALIYAAFAQGVINSRRGLLNASVAKYCHSTQSNQKYCMITQCIRPWPKYSKAPNCHKYMQQFPKMFRNTCAHNSTQKYPTISSVPPQYSKPYSN